MCIRDSIDAHPEGTGPELAVEGVAEPGDGPLLLPELVHVLSLIHISEPTRPY